MVTGWVKSNEASEMCFPEADIEEAALAAFDGTIYYNNVEQDGQTVSTYPFVSMTMKNYYLSAAMGCKMY